MATQAQIQAAQTIAARMRAIAPADQIAGMACEHGMEDTPASAAIADMEQIAEYGEDEAAGMIEMAIEATAEYTRDGYEDAEAAAARDAAQGA